MLIPSSLLTWLLITTTAKAASLPSPSPRIAAQKVRRQCLASNPSLLTLNTTDNNNIIYPPGYHPGISPFDLPIDHTPIALSCPKFNPSPHSNTTLISLLLDRLFHQFNSRIFPQERKRSVYNGNDLLYTWPVRAQQNPSSAPKPGDSRTSKPGSSWAEVAVSLEFQEPGKEDALTYGMLAIAVHGLEIISGGWPGLDMCCWVLMEEGGWLPRQGLVMLTSGDEREGEGDVMMEE